MRRVGRICAISCVAVLAACADPVPKCDDGQVMNLVRQISDKMLSKRAGVGPASTVSLEAIKNPDTSWRTGARECAADLKFTAANGAATSAPITYKVEKTNDGKNVFVNVFGL